MANHQAQRPWLVDSLRSSGALELVLRFDAWLMQSSELTEAERRSRWLSRRALGCESFASNDRPQDPQNNAPVTALVPHLGQYRCRSTSGIRASRLSLQLNLRYQLTPLV